MSKSLCDWLPGRLHLCLVRDARCFGDLALMQLAEPLLPSGPRRSSGAPPPNWAVSRWGDPIGGLQEMVAFHLSQLLQTEKTRGCFPHLISGLLPSPVHIHNYTCISGICLPLICSNCQDPYFTGPPSCPCPQGGPAYGMLLELETGPRVPHDLGKGDSRGHLNL